MLRFLFTYDHVNYARWDNVYLVERSVFLPEVFLEFQKGNVVVESTDRRFNQVSLDQSTDWLNVGIIRTISALSRWTLSYNLSTVLAFETTAILRLTTDDEDNEYTHNECTKSRMEKDGSEDACQSQTHTHSFLFIFMS